MGWKMATWILGTLLLVSNAWWFGQALNEGITQSYRETTLHNACNEVVMLSDLTTHLLKGKSKTELERILASVFPDEEPYEKEGCVNLSFLSFRLNPDDSVEQVEKDEIVVSLSMPDWESR